MAAAPVPPPPPPSGIGVGYGEPYPPRAYPTPAGTLTVVTILAVLGGVLISIGGVFEILAGSFLVGTPLAFAGTLFVADGLLGLSLGVVITVVGAIVPRHPQRHLVYGIILVVGGIASFVSYFGGFFFGLILAVVAGVLCMAWSPGPTVPRHVGPPNLPTCPRCGSGRELDARFCPNCGLPAGG